MTGGGVLAVLVFYVAPLVIVTYTLTLLRRIAADVHAIRLQGETPPEVP